MRWKGWFLIIVLIDCWQNSFAQSNVQITISYINPANTEYQMVVQNNNTGWWVDQVHVLYTTPGVLQATVAPPNWGHLPDVPWDAIPHNLRFEPNSPPHRIAPGQSRTFGFKMTTPTPMEDFYIQFRVVNASNQFKEFVFRVKVLQVIDVPKDALNASSTQTTVPGIGGPDPNGDMVLLTIYDFSVPTTRYLLETRDGNTLLRDSVFYPEIRDPPHLDHYFVGQVSREVNAAGALQGEYWTIDGVGAQWCGAAMGWSQLAWSRGGELFRRPTVQWQFTPSIRRDDGSRLVRLIIRNPGTLPLQGQFWLHYRGDTLLTGVALRRWRGLLTPDLQRVVEVPPNQQTEITFTIPAAVAPTRFFYGEFELRQRGLEATPTRVYFAHREVDSPLLVGYLASFGANRAVQVEILSPNTGIGATKLLLADGQGVWRVRLEQGDEPLRDDPGFYTPVWRVRVKPRGALSRIYQAVLLPGGDTLDPYLRMNPVLGDVNEDDCIDDADLLLVLFNFGATGDLPADLNQDRVVDDADLLLVLFNFGAGC
ncbi:MAG: hypothetical protein NZM10_03615 [Fimbriimonadales bacterium]|nr:hypothetical protein [Fimbriimonadales bacterium]